MSHSSKKVLTNKKDSGGCRGRIWIDGPQGTFLGYGRIVLLERIRDHGSIVKAARSMNMSYRHAWELIESMNSQSERPLVQSSSGGKGGGGTILTKDGERAIRLFWKFYEAFQKFLVREDSNLDILLRK